MPDDVSPNVTENGHAFPWTAQRSRAATLAAEDELTDAEIAARVGITKRTLERWKLVPAFAEKVRQLAREMGDAAARYAIGRKVRRLQGYDERRGRLLSVIEGRAADPSMQAVAGGPTGLLVRTVKSIGGGDNAQVVEEFAVDTGLLRELRELEKQAAQDAGQWVDKVAPTSPDGTHEYRPFTDAERRSVVAALFARLGLADDAAPHDGTNNGAGPPLA
jgi:hypothetical protein